MLIRFFTYLLLFVVPLVVVPAISLRFEPPKVLISELLIEALFLCLIVRGEFSLRKINKTLGAVIAGLFLLSLIHLMMDPSGLNLFGNVFRLQGTVLFWHLLLLALIAQLHDFRLKDQYIYLAGFVAVIAGAFISGSNSAGRWIGTLGEPNALGAVVVLMFPFVFLSFKQIWVRAIGVIGGIWVINFTESKSALIALGLQLWLLFLIKIFKEKYLAAVVTCVLLIIWSMSLPILERQYFITRNTDPYAFRFEDRTQIWEAALFAGLESPVYGSGIESIQGQIKKSATELNINAQYQVIDSSHNIILDFWIWGGAIGVGLLGILGGLGVRNMIQKKMKLELVMFIGLLTVLMFNPTTVTVLVGFWWVIGKSFGKEVREQKNASVFN